MLRETPITELILRRYERPQNLTKRELVRKFCLSLGLLQPGDGRDVVVDVLYVLLEAAGKAAERLSSEEICARVSKLRQVHNLKLAGCAPSNIRRQLKRLRAALIIEKTKASYRLTEGLPLSELIAEKIEGQKLAAVLSRLREYAIALDGAFELNRRAPDQNGNKAL